MPTPRILRMSLLSPLAILLASLAAHAQSTPSEQPLPPPRGQVLFQSHGEPPPTPDSDTPNRTAAIPPSQAPSGPLLTDAQRSSLLFTAYDLDARLAPATGSLTMRARITLRNIGSEPLSRIALQISSSLLWTSASIIPSAASPSTGNKVIQLPLAQHLIDTDADHTGKCSEAILDLPTPLAPGATITLDTLYSGLIQASAERLERIGASAPQGLAADWDTIGSGSIGLNSSSDSSSSSDQAAPGPSPSTPPTILVALRGFGDVLWYPTASPQLFLGDGATLFHAIGRQRLAEQQATLHLRLAVEYRGAPPVAAYLCSRRLPLSPHPDDPTAPDSTGIATADFPAQALGFRQLSLFVVQQPEVSLAPLPRLPTSISTSSAAFAPSAPQPDVHPSRILDLLSVETSNPDALAPLATSTELIAPLLQAWFGPTPLTPLTVLDHPGDPFEDHALLVAPITELGSSASSPALAHSLTHAWVNTGQPWIDSGLAQFISLLWIEQTQGRSAAILALTNLIQPLNIAEVSFDTEQQADAAFAPAGEPLISASSELYYRRKAAAVWWMLRGITGEKPLQQALTAWREQSADSNGPFNTDDPTVQAVAFERLLEKISGKDLGWFFSDWVLRDRGLPDLSIVNVEPRLLPAGKGHDSGWLVAVTVHNDGAPAVDAPLTILSGAFTVSTRIHIPGFSNATTRIIVASPPTKVILNDGSVPEVRAATHSREVVLHATPSVFQN